METEFNFDDMRSYNDDEVSAAMARVIDEPALQSIISFIFPNEDLKVVKQRLRKIKTVFDFQHIVIAPMILAICKDRSGGIEFNGIERLCKEKRYLFISNHRDIIMDAGILNSMLDHCGWMTTEMAVGDNLCVNGWITDCLRLNRGFLVKREGTKRELFNAFLKMSAYIRRNITEMRNSVWMAQREGRAKDSNDLTQESLLKMLSVSAVGSMKQGFLDLNIVPVAITYKYDSCDYLKAKEFQQKRDNPDFVKTREDDLTNMKVGILGNKGHIAYEICDTINDKIEEIVNEEDNRQTVLLKIAHIIDHCIHSNYHIFPHNYVALDNLNGTTQHLGLNYNDEEKKDFDDYVDQQIEKITLPQKDIPFLKGKIWLMYANPLINYLKAHENS